MEPCKVFIEMYGDDEGKVTIACFRNAGHLGPHEGVMGRNKVDRPGATCPNCRGRGTLESYVMNTRAMITWDA